MQVHSTHLDDVLESHKQETLQRNLPRISWIQKKLHLKKVIDLMENYSTNVRICI